MSESPFRTFANGLDVTEALTLFAKESGFEGAAPNRISSFLLLQLLMDELSTGDLSFDVLREVLALEGKGTSVMRAPTQFTRRPLHGLWHQHYREQNIRSLAINLIKGLRSHGLPKLEQAAASSTPESPVPFDVDLLAHEAVIDNYERLCLTRSMTGEWIIYSVFEGANYYLCLAKHDTGDDVVFNWISTACVPQFPFLADQIQTL